MAELQLEPSGQLEPRATDYFPALTEDASRVILNFSDIRQNGNAQIYLRSRGGLVRRIDTVSLFNLPSLEHVLFYPFKVGDEIGLALQGTGVDETLFRATVTLSGVNVEGIDSGGGIGGGGSTSILQLEGRVTTLELQIASLGSGTGTGDTSLSARVTGAEMSINSIRSDLSNTKSTVASQGQSISQNYSNLNSRLTALEQGGVSSGDGSGVSNAILKATLSLGSNPLVLNANLYDRVDIIGDRANTIAITNIKHATDERNLIIAAMTTKMSSPRTYTGIDVWMTPDNLAPVSDNRPGFGELIFVTNIHGASFAQVRAGQQFKYHAAAAGLIKNYPIVEASGNTSESLTGSGEALTVYGAPARTNEGGVVLGNGKYLALEGKGADDVMSIQAFFRLGSLATSAGQRIFTMTQGSTSGQALSFMLEQTTAGTWAFQYRTATGTPTVTLNGTPVAGVMYSVALRMTATSCEIVITRMDNKTSSVTTIANFAFSDSRESDAILRFGANAGVTPNAGYFTENTWFRAAILYNNLLSTADATYNTNSYL